MSIHIAAKSGEIADVVLICGDPLRARFIADSMLSGVFCYSEVRGMYGYTGSFNGRRVSVQGTGMGIPSTAIYVHELINEYGVKKILRIGTCGALQPGIRPGDLLVARDAFTDSAVPALLGEMTVPVTGDERLLGDALALSARIGIPVLSGTIFSTDLFYGEESERWSSWAFRGVLAVEMETAVLYSLAKKNGVSALTLLTVSDNIITGASFSAAEREQTSVAMMRFALELAVLN